MESHLQQQPHINLPFQLSAVPCLCISKQCAACMHPDGLGLTCSVCQHPARCLGPGVLRLCLLVALQRHYRRYVVHQRALGSFTVSRSPPEICFSCEWFLHKISRHVFILICALGLFVFLGASCAALVWPAGQMELQRQGVHRRMSPSRAAVQAHRAEPLTRHERLR